MKDCLHGAKDAVFVSGELQSEHAFLMLNRLGPPDSYSQALLREGEILFAYKVLGVEGAMRGRQNARFPQEAEEQRKTSCLHACVAHV